MPFLVFRGDHLRSTSEIICGSGSFGDRFRSGDHLRSGIICGAIQVSVSGFFQLEFHTLRYAEVFSRCVKIEPKKLDALTYRGRGVRAPFPISGW